MIKQIRAERHMSVPELSRLSGVSVRTIEKIEKSNGCTVKTAKRLALALNVSLDYLCADGKEEENESTIA